MLFRSLLVSFAVIVFAQTSLCQTSTDGSNEPRAAQGVEKANSPRVESKRILGLIPNYRTSPSLKNYEPLSVREKFKVASQDSFDRGTIALAALFGGEGQLTNASRSFGQGGAGFAR